MTESDDTLLTNLLSEIEQLKLADLRKYFKQLYGFEAKGFRMETLRRRIAYWQGDYVGFPGGKWRLRDVGEAHHNDRSTGCSGTIYHNGDIDGKGKLVGLPAKFVSSYSYNGYMELQQVYVMRDGSIRWPCPNG